jgi:hypothetical protein
VEAVECWLGIEWDFLFNVSCLAEPKTSKLEFGSPPGQWSCKTPLYCALFCLVRLAARGNHIARMSTVFLPPVSRSDTLKDDFDLRLEARVAFSSAARWQGRILYVLLQADGTIRNKLGGRIRRPLHSGERK